MQQLLPRLFLIAALSVLVFMPSKESETSRQASANIRAPTDSPNLESYSSEVKELLRTSYLGHGSLLPDPDEPVAVLREYLLLNTHKNALRSTAPEFDRPRVVPVSYGFQTIQADPVTELDQEIQKWRELVRQFPSSRHAWLGLATLEKLKADLTNDFGARRAAAEHYIQAAEIALSYGLVRHTHEVSRALVAVSDVPRLTATFSRILAVARTAPTEDHYLALVDYADGLARLGQPQAGTHFEQAIQLYPTNNVEAINRYSRLLLDQGDSQRAFAVLNQLSPDQRMMNPLQVFLRREAMRRLGLSTDSADQEVALLAALGGKDLTGGVRGPELGGAPYGVAPVFAHSFRTDDCRDPVYHASLHCPQNTGGWCFYPYTINLAEIVWNEARGESLGAQVMVSWTVRDRAYQGVSCDVYIGGVNYYSGHCENLPCNHPYQPECPIQRKYCCVEHGATFGVGAQQYQFNDAHQLIDDLVNSGAIWRSFYVINGISWEPSRAFVPPGVWNCVGDGCNTNICYSGGNNYSPSPLGPMEYRNFAYVPQNSSCKRSTGFWCSNGGLDNYFWNREN